MTVTTAENRASTSHWVNSWAGEWARMEARYGANAYIGEDTGPEMTSIDRGSKVLLVAAHGVNHHRPNGDAKFADRWTGSLAEVLGRMTGVSVVAATRKPHHFGLWKNRADGFARRMKQMADNHRVVIDLHGITDNHDLDLCIGIGPLPSELEHRIAARVVDTDLDLNTTIGGPFPALRQHTLTSHLQRHTATSAVQLGIAAANRTPATDPDRAEQILHELASIVRHAERASSTTLASSR